MPLRTLTRDQRHAVNRDRIDRARAWLIPCAVLWVPFGVGTLNGLAGKPTDAPHLLIPEEVRGVAWIMTGLVALTIMVTDRQHSETRTRAAASLLLIMPLVRFVSYGVAGVFSVVDLDGDGGLMGSPEAYYTVLPWAVISWAILSQSVDWKHCCFTSLTRRLGRRGRE